jgi:hypothetical protein
MGNAPGGALRFYGVIDINEHTVEPNGTLPVDGVSLVQFRDLGAVVAPAEYVSTEPDDTSLADYVRVIDGLHARTPVIPAPPGTIFRGANVLQHWMEIHYAKLHETLGELEQHKSMTPPYDMVRMEITG